MSKSDNNIITTYNGIDIFENDISVLCHEYESQFNDLEERINKPMFFTGLIVYLNRHLFKNITSTRYNNDYNALNDLFFDCFLPLCAKYNKTVTLQNFCIMTGIDNGLLSEILTGNYRDGSKVKTETYETVKKWKSTAESALIDNGMQGNPVFSIFALKAGHGWKESTELIVNGSASGIQASPEQIAEKYKGSMKPELPILEN